MAGFLLSGCAPTLYKPVDLNPALQSGKLIQKTNNFNVMFDRSASMDSMMGSSTRFVGAKEVTGNMVQTIPDMKLQAGLRQFGGDLGTRPEDLIYGMAQLNKDTYIKAVNNVKSAFGKTPMGKTMLAAGEDLKPLPGRSALIVVSDFESIKDVDDLDPKGALESAAKLKAEFGDKLCIYTVQIGSALGGKALAQQIAQKSGCGFSVNAAELATPQAMASFVERVFLGPGAVQAAGKAAPAAAAAVPAKTPDREGAAKAAQAKAVAAAVVLEKVYFDFDKAAIRPKEREVLKGHAIWLMANKAYKVLIEGHCDERGTTEYNLALGERRAAETKKFLVTLGVDEARLKTISYGKERPFDPAHNEAAWTKNRRAQFELSK